MQKQVAFNKPFIPKSWAKEFIQSLFQIHEYRLVHTYHRKMIFHHRYSRKRYRREFQKLTVYLPSLSNAKHCRFWLLCVRAAVATERFLVGKYQGYPFRIKVNGNYLEGFSDHFPVYAIIGVNRN